MELDYRTEIGDVFPLALYQNPAIAELLEAVGIAYGSRGNKMMQYRDPRTVFALIQAGPKAIELFSKNFGLTPYESGQEVAERVKFLTKHLSGIAEQWRSGAIDPDQAKRDVFQLHMFCHERMKGLKTGPDGKPVNHAWMFGVTQPVPAFDILTAMDALTAEADPEIVRRHPVPPALAEKQRKRWSLGRFFG